jgi:MoaA/NifB/PqqE/SkfB family radical SAM enzyme/precorrin-6B methylase 2
MESMNSKLEKSIERIKEEIDNIIENLNHIELNGGEPTLNKNLFKILEYIERKNKDIEIALITNARMFSIPSFAKKLKDLNLKRFKIDTTLYGADSKLHDAITRTPNSFNQQIRGIKNLINHGIKIELRIVINKINYKALKEISEFIIKNFRKEDILSVTFISIKYFGEAYKNRNIVGIRIFEIVPYLEKAVDILLKNNFKVNLFHFPHCILKEEYRKLSFGITAESEEIVFMKQCALCKEKENCSGIWKSYFEIFGENEFKSIERNAQDVKSLELEKINFLKSFSKEEWKLNGHDSKYLDIIQNNFDKILNLVKKGNYLEFGCGTGILCKYLSKFSNNKITPFGIDLKESCIILAKRNNPNFEKNFYELNYLKMFEPGYFEKNSKRIYNFESINVFLGDYENAWEDMKEFIEKIEPYISQEAKLIITAYDFNLNEPSKTMKSFEEKIGKKFHMKKISKKILLLKKLNASNFEIK